MTDSPEPEKVSQEALTSIRDMYTLSATDEPSEVDDIMIKEFIKTLAEVSMEIASREAGK